VEVHAHCIAKDALGAGGCRTERRCFWGLGAHMLSITWTVRKNGIEAGAYAPVWGGVEKASEEDRKNGTEVFKRRERRGDLEGRAEFARGSRR